MKYKVPYSFIPGTKASAEDVNDNFEYITQILENFSSYSVPFCVNQGPRDPYTNDPMVFTSKDGRTISPCFSDSDNPRLIYTNGWNKSVTPNIINPETQNQNFVMNYTPTQKKYSYAIPQMSSSVQGEFACVATSELGGNEVWHLFDRDENSYWTSQTGVTSASVVMTFSQKYTFSRYFLKVLTPAVWTLEGSNDSSEWHTLDTYTAAEPSEITRIISETGDYNTYRLSIEVLGDANFRVEAAEMNFYKEDSSGIYSFEEHHNVFLNANTLWTSQNSIFVQEKKPMAITNYDAIVPFMRTNVLPDGYTISASSFKAANPAYQAFDGKNDTYWQADNSSSTAWIQVQLPNEMDVNVCKITLSSASNAVGTAPVTGSIKASMNGLNWVTLTEFTNLDWTSPGESKYIYLGDLSSRYVYFRLEAQAPFSTLGAFQLFKENSSGEYLLGEAQVDDIWFKAYEPFEAYRLTSSGWIIFEDVPVGSLTISEEGTISNCISNKYNQNGLTISANTTKDFSGNIVTKDMYESHFDADGYVIFPNKLIVQWGIQNGAGNVIFPAAFPRTVFGVFPSVTSGDVGISSKVSNITNYGFLLSNYEGSIERNNIQNRWFAIGW